MPADGSQYLVTNLHTVTTRGDTSNAAHSQTVTYNNQQDLSTEALAANKVSVARQVTEADAVVAAVTQGPPTMMLEFTVDTLGVALTC